MNHTVPSVRASRNAMLLALALLCVYIAPAQAAPTILSAVTPNGATSPMVFTFSEAMDTATTSVMFWDGATLLAALPAWSGGNTILTCTPVAPWPGGHTIVWVASGRSAGGAELGGTTFAMFTGPAGNIGCDPAASMLSLTVSKGAMYEQTSAGAPMAWEACFLSCMTLPCPRDATGVTLQKPGGSPVAMAPSGIPGHLTLMSCPVQAPLDMIYSNGNYTINIQAASSNQAVTVNFPASLEQPPAPHLANYAAAQAIDPSQPFALAWDAFAGGTASDCVYVEIYGGAFKTPALGEAGALNGTATSVVIPANTLQPNHTYSGCVTFYHYILQTNGTSHLSLVYRSATTEFSLATTSGSTYRPAVTHLGWAGAGTFQFEVACPTGQGLVAECRTNLSLGQWERLCTTNSTTERVRFTDPAAGARGRSFYRVRTGS